MAFLAQTIVPKYNEEFFAELKALVEKTNLFDEVTFDGDRTLSCKVNSQTIVNIIMDVINSESFLRVSHVLGSETLENSYSILSNQKTNRIVICEKGLALGTLSGIYAFIGETVDGITGEKGIGSLLAAEKDSVTGQLKFTACEKDSILDELSYTKIPDNKAIISVLANVPIANSSKYFSNIYAFFCGEKNKNISGSIILNDKKGYADNNFAIFEADEQ